MFRIGKDRPPLTTAQRMDIELLMRRTIEVIGPEVVKQAIVMTEIDQLELDASGRQDRLETAMNRLRDRYPATAPCELSTASEDVLKAFSKYEPADGRKAARITIADELVPDPLRMTMELAQQLATHFWHSLPDSRELDRHPRTSHLLPICCGLGVLASESSLIDKQWSQAGWAGWSITRSGYYTPSEIGYALALLARFRREREPSWCDRLRPDSFDAYRKACRYFDRHRAAGGHLLFDAASIPSSQCDIGQLSQWLAGEDLTFALAAAHALSRRCELPSQTIQAAMRATHRGDRDLTPMAVRVLGSARDREDPSLRKRVGELTRDKSPQTALEALASADRLGIRLDKHQKTFSRLLELFAEDPFVLLEVIGHQGHTMASMAPQLIDHLILAMEHQDEEICEALIDCLQAIVPDIDASVRGRIKQDATRRSIMGRIEQHLRHRESATANSGSASTVASTPPMAR